MSLVNSMINQIGREIGRDVYRTSKSFLIASKNKSIGSNSLYHVKNFQISPYDKVTMRNLNILVDSTTSTVNPRSFDWEELFIELDKLIDSLKVTLKDSDYISELEALDKKVFVEYEINKQCHKNFVDKLIEEYKQKIDAHNSRNGFISFILTFVGANAFYTAEKGNKVLLGVFGVLWFLLGLATSLVHMSKIEPTAPHILGGVLVALLIMTPTILFSIIRGISSKFEYKENVKTLDNLQSYYSSNF